LLKLASRLTLAKLINESQAKTLMVRENESYHDITSTALNINSSSFAIASIHNDHFSNRKAFVEVYDITEIVNISKLASEEGQWGRIGALAFNHNGKYLAAGGNDGNLTTWSIASIAKLSQRIRLSNFSISSLDFGKGEEIACGSLQKGLRPNAFFLDLKKSNKPIEFPLDSQAVLCVRFNPNGDKLASIGGDKIVRINEIATLLEK